MEYKRIAETRTCCLTKGDDLTHLVVPDQFEDMAVVGIGDFAFAGFENLESITLPKNLEKLGKGAFSRCKKLVTIKIPTKVKNIPESCFAGCSSLKVVDFHDGIETIDKNAFFNCGFTKLIFPKKVTIIEEEAFAYCPNLSEVVLPSNLTMIKMGAFSGCSLLRNINLPDTLEVIEKDAFYSVYDLTLPYLPNDFIEIQEEAFDVTFDLPNEIDPAYFAKIRSKNKVEDANFQEESLIVSQKSKLKHEVFESADNQTENFSKDGDFSQLQSIALDNLYVWLKNENISAITVGEIYHSNFNEYAPGPYILYYDEEKDLNFFRLPFIVEYTEKNIPYFRFDQKYFDAAVSEKFVLDYKDIKSSAPRLFVQIDDPLVDKVAKFFTKKHLEKPSSLSKSYFYEYVFLSDPRYETIYANWRLCRKNFQVPNMEQFQGFSHLVKQKSLGSIQREYNDQGLKMIGIIDFISYSFVVDTLFMVHREKLSKKRPLRNTVSTPPLDLITNPFLWVKISVEERNKLDPKVLYPDTEFIENYDLGNDFYGLGGDHAMDALGDFESVSSSLTYEDAIADDHYLLEMEITPILRHPMLPIVYLLRNEKPHPSMYKYFQKFCFPKLKSPKDHEKYLSKLEDNLEGRFAFLVYLIALHPQEIFDNELQLPDLFAEFPQD